MNASSEAQKSRTRWVIALRVLGWMAASAALLVCALCAILFFNRSPGDFEGTGQMAAVHVGLVYGLPLLVVGGIIVWLAGRRAAHRDITSPESKATP
jgi:hypothetical protein